MNRNASTTVPLRAGKPAMLLESAVPWTHGWAGFALSYASVQIPMLVGLVRARAPVRKILSSPLAAAPLTLAVGIAMTAGSSFSQGLGLASDGLLQFALGAGVSATLGYVGGVAMGKRASSTSRHHRGAVISAHERTETSSHSASDSLVRFHTHSASGKAAPRNAQITLAGLSVALHDESKHFKLIGTTGTGKSTAVAELLAGALTRGDRAVIADPDYGYLRRFYDPRRGDVILNPFDVRSRKWDLFGEIADAYDIDQLSRSLIAEHGGSDRSWRDYSRTFFSAVTRQTHAAGETSVAELSRLLVVASSDELRQLLRGTPAQPFLQESNARMFDSIRSVTSSAVGSLDYIAQQDAPLFSVRQWVRGDAAGRGDGGGVLFIPYRAGQIPALRSTVSAWMRLAIFEAMNQPERDQRLWFVVDELDALGQIDGLKDALARLRKFGGRCVLGFQSIAQVSSTYGPGDAQTIVENCGNTLILRCAGSEHGGTSHFASRLIGQREVVRTTVSRSRRPLHWLASMTHAEHFNIEPAVLDSEIEQLPDLAGYLKFASVPEWYRVKLARTKAVNRMADPVQAQPAPGVDGAELATLRARARRAWHALRAVHQRDGQRGPKRAADVRDSASDLAEHD